MPLRLPLGGGGHPRELDMADVTRTVAIPKPATATEAHPLVTITLFCAIGLLLSLCVVLLDQYLPGEWF